MSGIVIGSPHRPTRRIFRTCVGRRGGERPTRAAWRAVARAVAAVGWGRGGRLAATGGEGRHERDRHRRDRQGTAGKAHRLFRLIGARSTRDARSTRSTVFYRRCPTGEGFPIFGTRLDLEGQGGPEVDWGSVIVVEDQSSSHHGRWKGASTASCVASTGAYNRRCPTERGGRQLTTEIAPGVDGLLHRRLCDSRSRTSGRRRHRPAARQYRRDRLKPERLRA